MRICFVYTALLFSMQMVAQEPSFYRVDFNEVKSSVTPEGSPFYYPVLFERYQNADTAMTPEEFRYLYYGFTFQKNYQPYRKPEAEAIINDVLQQDSLTSGDFSSILRHCAEMLQVHPFSTRHLLISAIACTQTGNPDQARDYYYKYDRIISAILSSGDGATEESAWSVILIPDEYELISALGFQRTGQQKMLHKSLCDFVYVSANEHHIEGFYFDISRPFSKGFGSND